MASDEQKARYGAFIVYPESAPENWWDILRSSHGSYARSPLHEPDGECTKPHFHVIYKHSNTVRLEAMKRVIPAEVPANGYVELVAHPRNYQRYLVHLDNPEKQQWKSDPRELIEVCNGFPLDLTRDFSQAERSEQRRTIMQLIRVNGVCEYADLLEGLADTGKYDLLDYAWNHTIALTAYLRSRRHRGAVSYGEREEIEREAVESARERAELEAGNAVMNILENTVKHLQD